jgi:hypothetical protein
MTYNKEYYCTYPFIFELLSEDGDNNIYTEEEKDVIQQISYKNDLLNIFFLSESEEDNINSCIQTHFDSMDPQILECAKTLSLNNLNNDIRFGFSLLFAYHYLHYTHTCICEFLTDGKISEKSLQDLNKAINDS